MFNVSTLCRQSIELFHQKLWYKLIGPLRHCLCIHTVMILSFRKDTFGQTVQTQIRLLLEEQSDQGLHCLLFHSHLFNEIL